MKSESVRFKALGVLMLIMAAATFMNGVQLGERVDRQSNQIDALYEALQREQDARAQQGGFPITPPPSEIVKNPSLVTSWAGHRDTARCGILENCGE